MTRQKRRAPEFKNKIIMELNMGDNSPNAITEKQLPETNTTTRNSSATTQQDNPANDEIKIQYLGFVQAIIARMSNYSCAIKGSCCVILIGLMTVLSQTGSFKGTLSIGCLALLVLSTIAMSVFDAKYLQLERQYRVLYSLIDTAEDSGYPTDLKPCKPCAANKTRKRDAYFSWSVFGFYLAVCIMGIASWAILSFG